MVDPAGWSFSPLLYVLTLEPMLNRLRDEMEYPALRGVPFAGCLRAKVTSYADGITAFVSRQSDMKTVRKVIERYEEVAKINFEILPLQFCCCNFAVGCLEGWRSPAWTFPLEWRTHLHSRVVVWARLPNGTKLVGCTGQGRLVC